LSFVRVEQPKQMRDTRIVKDVSPEEIAREIVAWVRGA
jgi:electron transfer flavoprotein beta subunit